MCNFDFTQQTLTPKCAFLGQSNQSHVYDKYKCLYNLQKTFSLSGTVCRNEQILVASACTFFRIYMEWKAEYELHKSLKCVCMLLHPSKPFPFFRLAEFDTALAWSNDCCWILNRLWNDFPLVTHSSCSIYRSASSQSWQVQQVTRRQL